jgi:flagellar basal-body rod protein FlgC
MSLFSTLHVSGSGLDAQRLRVEVLAQNVANAQTTRTPEGGPYRRRHVVFESEPVSASPFRAAFADLRSAGGPLDEGGLYGVRVSRVVADEAPPERRYLPQHPDANAEGYVEFPSFHPVEDMVDLSAAVRSYQANLAVIAAVKEMIQRTMEISQ